MKKLTIIVPCYNEIGTLSKVIEELLKIKNIKKQIIVIDDCSYDGSKNVILRYKKDGYINAVFHKENLGKGACIISAQKLVRGDIVIVQDADLEYNPKDIPKLIKPIINLKYKAVYGSRVLGRNYFDNLKNFSHWIRILGNLFLTKFSNIINNQTLTDAHTCYKVFDAKLFKKIKLKEKNFNFCPEITTKISNIGIKIHEIPINYKGRDYSQGKKIKLKDAFKALFCIVKYKIKK
jgi:dolichol-phosphate mannosyltransferase